jgi:hypothetical protein
MTIELKEKQAKEIQSKIDYINQVGEKFNTLKMILENENTSLKSMINMLTDEDVEFSKVDLKDNVLTIE